jgi:3-oxoacyl-[acyl-carrier protein] reductase
MNSDNENYIFVTGALSGIGKETIKYLAENKYNLIAGIQHQDDNFIKWSKKLEVDNKISVITLIFDLSDENSIKNAVKDLRSKKIKVSGLVNIAGVTKDANTLMVSSEDMMDIYRINVVGQVVLTQYLLRTMLKNKKGSVVFVSSISGIDGISGQLSYSSSKGALIPVAKTFSRELGQSGIRFNVIAPGVIDTEMNNKVPEDILKERLARTCLKRIGKPNEVAKVIHFLISDMSSYITGQVIRIDGGFK